MCGLVGMAGHLDDNDHQKFRELLLADTIRGPAATGVAAIKAFKEGLEVDIIKDVGSTTDLFRKYPNALNQALTGNYVIIGHNRAPTIGENSESNAHPFEHGKIVGCHNGTIMSASLQDLPTPVYRSITDSEKVMINLDKHSPEEVVKYLNGAWTFVWFDKELETVSFLRNKERPLYYAYKKGRRVIYWASEAPMLTWVLGREDMKTHPVELDGPPIELAVNELMTVELLPIFEQKTLRAKTRPVVGGAYKERPKIEWPKEENYWKGSGNRSSKHSRFREVLSARQSGQSSLPGLGGDNVRPNLPVFRPPDVVRAMTDQVLSEYRTSLYEHLDKLEAKRERTEAQLLNYDWSNQINWSNETERAVRGIISSIKGNLVEAGITENYVTNVVNLEVNSRPTFLKKEGPKKLDNPLGKLESFRSLKDLIFPLERIAYVQDKGMCALCGEDNPENIDFDNSLEFPNGDGFVCDTCVSSPDGIDKMLEAM